MAFNVKQFRRLIEPGMREWVPKSGLPEALMAIAKLPKAKRKKALMGVVVGLSEAFNPELKPPRR